MRGLFRYDVPGRVTVPDRSSTLVSLVNRTIDGEDLLIYRPDAGGAARHYPYRAVRYKNDTGYMLQGGPVSVLSKGMFVGSGVFDRIEADAETFLPFSLERGISRPASTNRSAGTACHAAMTSAKCRAIVSKPNVQPKPWLKYVRKHDHAASRGSRRTQTRRAFGMARRISPA